MNKENTNTKNIFIFGATGAVGSAFLKQISYESKDVQIHIVFSEQINKYKEDEVIQSIKKINNVNFKIYTKDIFFQTNFNELNNLSIVYSWGVFDLSKNQKKGMNIESYLNVNFVLLKDVIIHLVQNSKTIDKIIYISSQSASDSVIDKIDFNNSDYKIYGISKRMSENFVSLASNIYKTDTVIIRPGTLIGRGDKDYRLIGEIVKNSLQGKSTTIIGSETKRNYLSYSNLAVFICKTLENKLPNKFQIINVSGQKTSTVNEIVNASCKYLVNEYKLNPVVHISQDLGKDILYIDESVNFGFAQVDDLEIAITESIDSIMKNINKQS